MESKTGWGDMQGKAKRFKTGWDDMHKPGWVYPKDNEYYGPCSRPCSTPKPPQMTSDEAANLLRLQNIRTAKAALEYYNRTHLTNYELVDPIISNGSVRTGGIWCHCNFTARSSSESSLEAHQDSSTKLFFAELNVVRGDAAGTEYLVTGCRPLDNTKIIDGCGMCGKGISHPSRGFRQGLYEFKHRDLRPRRNGRVVQRRVQWSPYFK